jgi:hypothetical protein
MIERAKQRVAMAAAAWLSVALGADLAAAQTPPAPAPPRGEPQGPRFRDPTQPSPEVRQAIEATQAAPTAANPAGPIVPQIKLKAKLIGSIGQPVAVLDVNDKLYVVHADTEIEAPLGSGSRIMVRELNATEVRIEMLPLKRIVVLR